MNSLASSLLLELQDCVSEERSLSADSFPQDTILEEEQGVSWVSSTFDGLHLINIFEVSEGRAPPSFIASGHSDGGVVVFVGGPWGSRDAAEASFGEIDEEWARL